MGGLVILILLIGKMSECPKVNHQQLSEIFHNIHKTNIHNANNFEKRSALVPHSICRTTENKCIQFISSSVFGIATRM